LKSEIPDPSQALIDELLRQPPSSVPALLGRRLETVLNVRFIAKLEERLKVTPRDTREWAAVEGLLNTVLEFSEEVAARITQLEPVIAEKSKVAAETAAEVSGTDTYDADADADAKTFSDCGTFHSSSKAVAASAAPAATGHPQRHGGSQGSSVLSTFDEMDPSNAEAVERARFRFRVHRLLDAAHVSEEALDRELETMDEELTPGFFRHMQWEVEQQIKMRNRKLLDILELIVQRACAQREAGQPDVQLLSILLQMRNPEMRAQMYEERLRHLDSTRQQRFASTVVQTQMHLEKALLSGEPVDVDLLTQLRLISIEMTTHIKVCADRTAVEKPLGEGP